MKHIKDFDKFNETLKDDLGDVIKKGAEKLKSWVNPPVVIEYKVITEVEKDKDGKSVKETKQSKVHKYVARYSYDYVGSEDAKLKEAEKKFTKEWKKNPNSKPNMKLKIISSSWSPGNSRKLTMKFR